MANTRIKDLSTTAASAANDDYLALDGATNGTRKILASNVGGVTKADYYKVFATDTATGNPVSITDGADDIPVVDLTASIEPSQSGSGDPSPNNIRPISGWNSVNVTVTGDDDTETYTTSLGTTVYGGTLDLTTGVLTVDRAIADMGDLTWSVTGDRMTVATRLTPTPVTKSSWDVTNPIAICSCYKYGNIGNNNGVDKAIGFYNGYLYARDTDYSDANAFKTAVVGQTICYELATPTTVQLTAQEIKTFLGNNSISADTGDVTVTYRADTGLYIAKVINNQ